MIELKNVSFTYLSENSDESSAELNGSLSNINLRIEKGSFVLLTGPSGCGKSTLLRLINGLIPHYYSGKLEGEVMIDGELINDKPLCKSAEKIGTVFQNPRSQFFNVDTTSELAFLSENLGVEAEIIKSRIKQTAESFQIKNLLDRSIFHLSDGEKQKIACASIEVGKPEIILLDEPSANLDYHATMQLRKLIAQWVRQGRTVIAAEHRLFYLWDLIDRVVLMDDGKIIKDYNKNELNKLSDNDLSELGLRSAHSPAPTGIELPVVTTDDKTLTINSLRFGYKQGFFNRSKVNNNIIDIHNMELALGKITAITAANGEGKTTFLNCLCGLERRSKDDIIINGAPFKRRNRLNSFFMVMQDTNHQLFTDSVLEEVMISLPEPNEDKALKILESVDLVCYKERHPMALSGGQKQRLAIACAVASERDYILFDEPTSGLDYVHMKEIAALMRQLRNLGKTVIIVTHDSEFIEACCERKVNFVSRS